MIIVNNGVLTLELYSYPVGNGLDTANPQCLVELGVQPNISRPHRFTGEFDDGFHGPRSTLFEGAAVHEFVQMNSVFASYNILKSGALAAGLRWVGKRIARENIVTEHTLSVFVLAYQQDQRSRRIEHGCNVPCLEDVRGRLPCAGCGLLASGSDE